MDPRAGAFQAKRQVNDRMIVSLPSRTNGKLGWRREWLEADLSAACMTAIISGPKYGSIIPCREKKWFYRRNIFRVRLYFRKGRAERPGRTNGLISSEKGPIARVGNARKEPQNEKWP